MSAYLDNSATTRPTEAVIEAMAACMRGGFYNPSSLYAPAIAAEKAMARCRTQILDALHGDGQVLFTSGGTEANNLAVLGVAALLRDPKPVWVSAVEHPSVLAACDALSLRGFPVTRLPVDPSGALDFDFIERALSDSPALVSCMQVNNETGALPDIARLSALLRARCPNALLHVDGVQGFLRVPFDASLCDLYTLSAHKLHGPKGVGALYVRRGVRLAPRQIGGGQEGGLRSGTENTPGIAGLSAAIATFPADAAAALRDKKRRLLAGLRDAVPALVVNGPDPESGAPHILNVSFPPVRGEVLLHALEGAGVCVSTGSACSSKKRKVSAVLTAMGVAPAVAEGALRFSLSPHTSDAEIDEATRAVKTCYATLSRYQRR